MDPLFPSIPESADELAALTDEQIAETLDASLAAKDKIVAQDPEFLGDRDAPAVLAEMQAGVAGILRLKAEQASRVEAQSNLAAELAALNAQVTPDTALSADGSDAAADDDDADAGTDDAAAAADVDADASADAATADVAADEPALEPVTAAAPPARLRRLPAAGRHIPIPANQRGNGMALVASAGLSGFRPGEAIDSEEKLAYAMIAASDNSVATPAGFSHKVVVARADLKDDPTFPEFRRIRSGDDEQAKIKTLVAAAEEFGITMDEEALTASGGICAPVTPYYQLANVSTVQRPVRDSLVGFIADRGGIRFAPPPVISDITTAVGIITAEQDAAGGSTGTKSCQTVICPDFQEVDVDAIFHCVTAGNLGARAFPEQIAQFNALVLAQHARVAETNLLNKIKAGSTAVTANGQSTHGDGVTATLLNDILVAAAGLRSRNRMMQDTRLQVILPAWTADMLVADLVASQFQRFAYNQSGVEQLLATFNIQVAWTLDGPSDGTAQVFGAQSPGAVIPFPTAIQWPIFPAGSWLFVDTGVLELGIVRDSVLNATNSYQIFGESWESAAGIGVESLWVTSTACATGVVSAAAAPAGC